MNTSRITGTLFEKMIKNGYANLQKHEDELNKLNVFPVADGDTGTNMRITLEKGIKNAKSSINLCDYFRGFNEGMLFGARGNSGAIFSQLFSGIYNHLERCSAASVRDMRNAFIKGYKKAYQAVVVPREGTILTVAREGIENIKDHLDRSTSIEVLFSMYISEMKKSLKNTPELLAVLKDNGVIDSGALGYIIVIEGMLMYLYGEIVETVSIEEKTSKDDNLEFNEFSSFEEGYCMEFILQLLKDPNYDQNFRLNNYIKILKNYGESIVAVQDKTRVKIHIHTKKPSRVISSSQEYGEFVTFKLENMQLQANEKEKNEKFENTLIKEQTLHKNFTVITFTDSVESGKMFLDLGCDIVHIIKDFSSISSTEISDVIKLSKTNDIVLLPNSFEVYQHVKGLQKTINDKMITCVKTSSLSMCYYTLALDLDLSDDLNEFVNQLNENLSKTDSVNIFVAKQGYSGDNISWNKGMYLASYNNHVVKASNNLVDLVCESFKEINNIDDKESCVIFTNDLEIQDELREKLEDLYMLDVTFFECEKNDQILLISLV